MATDSDLTTLDADQQRTRARVRKVGNVLAFSLLSGGVLGILAYSIGCQFRELIPLVVGVGLSFLFGAFTGLCCYPFVQLLLVGRDLNAARPLILWTSAVVTGVLAAALPEDWFLQLMVVAGCGFIAAAFFACITLPRIWDKPGHCRACGYDLCASTEFKRCPECGLSIGEEADSSGQPDKSEDRRLVTRCKHFLLRHPFLPLLLIALAFFGRSVFYDIRHEMRRVALVRSVEHAVSEGSVLNLSTSAPFKWDTVFILGPAPPYVAVQTLASHNTKPLEFPPVHRYGYWVVFARKGVAIEHLTVFRWGADASLSRTVGFSGFAESCCDQPIPRELALFKPEEVSDGTVHLVQQSIPEAP